METLDVDLGEDGPAVAAGSARAKANAANGKKGGRPPGNPTLSPSKRTYDDEKLAADFADRLLAGGKLPTSRAGPPTKHDHEHVARITGVTVEEFQGKFLQRLMSIADKAVNRIEEKLDGDEQKLSDLNMTLAISVDKMAAISGRTAQAGNVSVTVNNYGAMSREQMLAQLDGEKKVGAIDV